MKTKQTQDTNIIKIRISMNYERKRSKNKVVLHCAFSRYEKTQKWNPAARYEGLVETPWWNDYVATTWYNNQRSPSSKCFQVFSLFTCLTQLLQICGVYMKQFHSLTLNVSEIILGTCKQGHVITPKDTAICW